jgi:hypothetical protein
MFYVEASTHITLMPVYNEKSRPFIFHYKQVLMYTDPCSRYAECPSNGLPLYLASGIIKYVIRPIMSTTL